VRDLRSWLVLGLVIEQPSYGYELSRRYRSRFGRLLPMALPRTYEMLDVLRDHGLIEPAKLNEVTRQTALRHSFCATARGIAAYRGWLSSETASRVALGQL
jgi:DNA-binding PadR family transcriptional regulator